MEEEEGEEEEKERAHFPVLLPKFINVTCRVGGPRQHTTICCHSTRLLVASCKRFFVSSLPLPSPSLFLSPSLYLPCLVGRGGTHKLICVGIGFVWICLPCGCYCLVDTFPPLPPHTSRSRHKICTGLQIFSSVFYSNKLDGSKFIA